MRLEWTQINRETECPNFPTTVLGSHALARMYQLRDYQQVALLFQLHEAPGTASMPAYGAL